MAVDHDGIGIQRAAAAAGRVVRAAVALIAVLIVVIPRTGEFCLCVNLVAGTQPADLQNLLMVVGAVVNEADVVAAQSGKAGGERAGWVVVCDALVAAGNLPGIAGRVGSDNRF